jgi:hypothetical protein
MLYPYRCDACGTTRDLSIAIELADTDPTKRLYDQGRMVHECGPESSGTYKRVWRGVRISTYRNVVKDPRTGQDREVTSEREFQKILRDQSTRATDYTGIPHDYQPVDLHDPSVAPSSDQGIKSQHDAMVKSGEIESKGKFVHTLTDP